MSDPAPRAPGAPCHACAGRFLFVYERDRFVAKHTLPYCKAFEAIDGTLAALRFARACDEKGD